MYTFITISYISSFIISFNLDVVDNSLQIAKHVAQTGFRIIQIVVE